MGNGKNSSTPTPPLTGNSLHQSLEEATRQHSFPDSLPLNPQQPAVDWTVDSRVSWRIEPGKTPIDNALVEIRRGGEWVQNKRLTYGLEKPGVTRTDAEAFASLKNRIANEAKTTAEKFDAELVQPSGNFRTMPNGQRYKIEMRGPDRVTLHMEVPDWGKLTAEQRRQLYDIASKELSKTAHRNAGVRLGDPVPEAIVKKVGLSVNDVSPAAKRLLAKIEGKTLQAAERAVARATIAEAAQFAKVRGGRGMVRIGGVLFFLAIVGTGVYLTKDMGDEERVQFLGEIGVDFAAGLTLDAIVGATITRLAGAGVAETLGGWPIIIATTFEDDRYRPPERRAAEAFVKKYFPDEADSEEKIAQVQRDMATAVPLDLDGHERVPRVARSLHVERADEPIRGKAKPQTTRAQQSRQATPRSSTKSSGRAAAVGPDFSALHRAADEAIRRRAARDAQFRFVAPTTGARGIPEARAAAAAAIAARTRADHLPGADAGLRAAAQQAASMAQDAMRRSDAVISPAFRTPIVQPPVLPMGQTPFSPPIQTLPPVSMLPVATMPTAPMPLPVPQMPPVSTLPVATLPVPIPIPMPFPQMPDIGVLPVATMPTAPVPIPIPVSMPQMPDIGVLPVATMPTAPVPIPIPVSMPQMPDIGVLPVAIMPTAPVPIPIPVPVAIPQAAPPVAPSGPMIQPPFQFQMDPSQLPFNDASSLPLPPL